MEISNKEIVNNPANLSKNGDEILKKFASSIKENDKQLDYFHILENISNQKLEKDIINSIFSDRNII